MAADLWAAVGGEDESVAPAGAEVGAEEAENWRDRAADGLLLERALMILSASDPSRSTSPLLGLFVPLEEPPVLGIGVPGLGEITGPGLGPGMTIGDRGSVVNCENTEMKSKKAKTHLDTIK